MNWLERPLQNLAQVAPSQHVQYLIGAVVFLVVLGILVPGVVRNYRQPTPSQTDALASLVLGVTFGALTGILWAYFNPVTIVPPFIHWRLFAFIPPLVGFFGGRRAGFITGYVATIVWASLAGAFVALHTPFADAIMVGLTGWLPAAVMRGDLSNGELLERILSNTRGWYIRLVVVCAASALLMSAVAAVSLAQFTPLSFWVSFWAIGVVSDTGPIILGTALFLVPVLKLTRPHWSWAPAY